MRPADLDFRSPGNVQSPFALYRRLRDEAPVHWSEGLRAWVVTRYEDVVEILKRPERFASDRFRKVGARFSSDRPAVRAVAEILGDWLVFRDPPDHTRLRALLQKSFTPRTLDRSRALILGTVDSLLDKIERAGDPEIEFIRDFAFPLPAVVIASLLGCPAEDIDEIKSASDQLAAYLGGAIDDRDNFARAQIGVESLTRYFRGLLSARERTPGDDLMSLMLRAQHEGQRLTHAEVVSNCVLLLFAGHETTTNLLGNGLFHLLQHPEQERRARRDSELVVPAVEEFLRFDGPVPATTKIASEDFTWHGASIRRGDQVLPFLSSANRDERAFADPDRLEIARQPNRHLAFAYGIHFCLGAPLARLEATIAFERLFRRFPKLELDPSRVRFKPQLFLRGLESLPLRPA